MPEQFLYSQDLSNCTTIFFSQFVLKRFLYSQDLSNCTTNIIDSFIKGCFCTLKI